MARIKLYESSTAPATSRGGGMLQANFQASDFGDGSSVREAASMLIKRQEHQDNKTRLDISNKIANERLTIAKDVARMEAEAPLGAPNHVANTEAYIQKKLAGLKQGYDERFHAEIDNKFSGIQANNIGSAIRFESAKGAEKVVYDFEQGSSAFVEAAIETPDEASVDSIIADLDKLVFDVGKASTGEYTPEMREILQNLRDERVNSIEFSASQERIARIKDVDQLDKYVNAMKEDGSVSRQRLNEDGFTKLLDFADSRRKQIPIENEKARLETDTAYINQKTVDFYALLKADLDGDPTAAHNLERMRASMASATLRDVNGAAGLLAKITNYQISQAKAEGRAGIDVGRVKYEKKVADLVQGIGDLENNVTREQLDAMWEGGFFEGKGAAKDYERARRMIRSRDRLFEAQAKGTMAEIRSAREDLEREQAAAEKERIKIDRDMFVYEAGQGVYTEAEIRANSEWLGDRLDNALKAANGATEEGLKVAQKQAEVDFINGLSRGDIRAEDASRLLDEVTEKYKLRDSTYGLGILKSLSGLVNSQLTEARMVNEMGQLIQHSMTTGGAMASRVQTAKQKQMFDAAFNQLVGQHEAQLRTQISDEMEIKEAIVDIRIDLVAKTGVMPMSMKNSLMDNLYSQSDPKAALSAAYMIDRIHSANPVLTKNIITSDKDFSLAQDILSFSRQNYNAEEAYAKAIKMREDAYSATGETMRARYATETAGNANAVALEELVDSSDKFNPWLDSVAKYGPRFISDFESLTRSIYMENGDLALAQKTAFKRLEANYDVTLINGDPRIMYKPPEKEHRKEGLTLEENADWQRKQIIAQAAIHGHYIQDPSTIRMVAHPTLKTEDGRATYLYFHAIDGVQYPITEMNGTAPDWETSPRADYLFGLAEFEQDIENLEKAQDVSRELEKREFAEKVMAREAKRGGGQ